MARLSIILREQKRRKAVAKFAAKRKALFEIIGDARASDEARAEARARLAADILRQRLSAQTGGAPLRFDLIGVASVLADDAGRWLAALETGDARDVRLRAALNHAERHIAECLTREVTALYTCGPAGGGGVRTALRQRLGTVSCTVPREQVPASFCFIEAAP